MGPKNCKQALRQYYGASQELDDLNEEERRTGGSEDLYDRIEHAINAASEAELFLAENCIDEFGRYSDAE